jgi:hypothetical protein
MILHFRGEVDHGTKNRAGSIDVAAASSRCSETKKSIVAPNLSMARVSKPIGL